MGDLFNNPFDRAEGGEDENNTERTILHAGVQMAKGGLVVVEGAQLVCSQGTNPSTLIVTTSTSTRIGNAKMATILDHKPGVNILPFGTCNRTGQICTPNTPNPWIGIPLINYSTAPTLSLFSCLKCEQKGNITIADTGQSGVYAGEDIMKEILKMQKSPIEDFIEKQIQKKINQTEAEKKAEVEAKIKGAVKIAEGYIGSKNWERIWDYPYLAWKCNFFVGDVLKEAGIPIPWTWQDGTIQDFMRPPLAQEWSNTNYHIPGWTIVHNPQPGDVVAFGGHVGIVYKAGESISADGNSIVKSPFGFRSHERPVFRRYIGN